MTWNWQTGLPLAFTEKFTFAFSALALALAYWPWPLPRLTGFGLGLVNIPVLKLHSLTYLPLLGHSVCMWLYHYIRDAWPMRSTFFPADEHHSPLARTKLYCSVAVVGMYSRWLVESHRVRWNNRDLILWALYCKYDGLTITPTCYFLYNCFV